MYGGVSMGGFIDMQQLHDELLTHLITTLTPRQMKQLEPHLAPLIQNAAQAVAEDLIAYAYRDPASRGRGELILESYASFKAVLFYRLAHLVWHFQGPDNGDFSRMALKLSNQGKILSGAEIHPAARIGRRLPTDERSCCTCCPRGGSGSGGRGRATTCRCCPRTGSRC